VPITQRRCRGAHNKREGAVANGIYPQICGSTSGADGMLAALLSPAGWHRSCPMALPQARQQRDGEHYWTPSSARAGSGGQMGVPAAQLRALRPALGSCSSSARFTAAIKSELDPAPLLHRHSLGINRSLPDSGKSKHQQQHGTPPEVPSPR